MEMLALLVSMDGIISRIEIKPDRLRGMLPLGLDIEIDQEVFDGCAIINDLLVPVNFRCVRLRKLQAVEGALTGDRGFSISRHAIHERTEERIIPKLVMVIQVLVTQAKAEHSLRE
jgi:hypothetical protein